MKRKLLFTLIALLAAITSAQADGTLIDGLYYNLNATTRTAEVTYKHGVSSDNSSYVSGNVVIPKSITYSGITYSVTSIGKSAFGRCSSLTSITIPNSVTRIEQDAFSDCKGLTAVHISDIASWCAIDFWGFVGSSSNPLHYAKNLYLNGELVTDLIIPESVKKIKGAAFERCSSLTSVTIPNSVTSIGGGAFYGCSSLKSVTIPNSVTSIRFYAFYRCSSLTSITIPNSVTSIEKNAFSGCKSLKKVTIPNSVTSIEQAFWLCSSLTTIYNYAETPQNINAPVFSGADKSTCTLYVPANSVELYKKAEGWKDFIIKPISD